jgi:hypothetical protein
MAAKPPPSAFVRWLTEASYTVDAVAGFLERIVGLLRQLVRAAGLADLLFAAIIVPIHPHISPIHLVIIPGAGVLAVLQSLIGPRQQQDHMTMISPSKDFQLDVDLDESRPNQTTDL